MASKNQTDPKDASSIYEFSAKDIDGNEISLEKYKGYVTIICNVACKCGFTETNYKQLPELYEQHEKDGLRIACFPSNEFGGQEPWTEEEIKKFVTEKYGVKFDMYSKINVNGDKAHPLYVYLKHKQGGTLGDFIKWNFTKFVVDRQGQPVKRYAPNTAPKDMMKDIEQLLKQ